jgi:Arc/MetJ-type ribon-helix-helix transcriptional regulator
MSTASRPKRAKKARVTITVDAELVRAAEAAVVDGRAESLSAFVNQAVAKELERQRGKQALGAAIAAYEAKYGAISDDDIQARVRENKQRALVVRGRKPRRRRVA